QLAAIVAAARALERFHERLVRLLRGDLVEHLNGLEPRTGRGGVVFANRHDYAPSRNSGIFSPSRSFTYAFFQSGRRPANRPCRLILPWEMVVRMLSTFEPSSCSIARLIWTLLAPTATWKTIVRPSSRRIDVFSVMSGRRITSVSFIV